MAGITTATLDAIATSLNAQSFSLPFTAATRCIPEFTEIELQTLQVCVTPKANRYERGSRGTTGVGPQAYVVIMQKLGNDPESETRALIDLSEEIAKFLLWNRLEPVNGAEMSVPLSVENDPIYVKEQMDKGRIFQALLPVTYEAQVALN